VDLAAPGALGDLRALVLGDHPLELAQELVLGRARALSLLGEADLDTGAPELLEQQHLVGIAAREAVVGVAEQQLEGALGGAIAQALERRALKRGARETLVLEDQIVCEQQAALSASSRSPVVWL